MKISSAVPAANPTPIYGSGAIASQSQAEENRALEHFLSIDVERFFDREFGPDERRPFFKYLAYVGNALGRESDRGTQRAQQLEHRLGAMARYWQVHGVPDIEALSEVRRVEYISRLVQSLSNAQRNADCIRACRQAARELGDMPCIPETSGAYPVSRIADTLTKLWSTDRDSRKSLTRAIDQLAAWVVRVATRSNLNEHEKTFLALAMSRCRGNLPSADAAFRHMVESVLDPDWCESYDIRNAAPLLLAMANAVGNSACRTAVNAGAERLLRNPARCKALCDSPQFHYVANVFTRTHLFGTAVDPLRDWFAQYLAMGAALPENIARSAKNLAALVAACRPYDWKPIYGELVSKAVRAVLDDKSVLTSHRRASPYVLLIEVSSRLPEDAACRAFHVWAIDHLNQRPIGLARDAGATFFWDEPVFELPDIARLLDASLTGSPQLVGTLANCLERHDRIRPQHLGITNKLLMALKNAGDTLRATADHRDFSATIASLERTQRRLLDEIDADDMEHANPRDITRILSTLRSRKWISDYRPLVDTCFARFHRFGASDFAASKLESLAGLCRSMATMTLLPDLGHEQQAKKCLDKLLPIVLKSVEARLDNRELHTRATLDEQLHAIDHLQVACGIYGTWDASHRPTTEYAANLGKLRDKLKEWKARLPASPAAYERIKNQRERALRGQWKAGQPASVEGLALEQPARVASRCDHRAHFAALAGPLRAVGADAPGMVAVPLIDGQGKWLQRRSWDAAGDAEAAVGPRQQFSVPAALTGNEIDMISVELRHFDNEYAIEYGVLPEVPPFVYTAQSFYRIGVIGGNRNKARGPSLNQLARGDIAGRSGSSYALPDCETHAATDLGKFMAAAFATQESAIGYGDRMLCPAGDITAGDVDFMVLGDGDCLTLTDGTRLRVLDGWGVMARSTAEQLNGFADTARAGSRPYGAPLAGYIPAQALQHYPGSQAVVDEITAQIDIAPQPEESSIERELRKFHGDVRGELALVAPSSDDAMHVPIQKALGAMLPDQQLLIGASPYSGPNCLATLPASSIMTTSQMARLLGRSPVIQYAMLGMARAEGGQPMVGLKGLALVVDDDLLPQDYHGKLALSHKDIKVGRLEAADKRRGPLRLTGYFAVHHNHPPGSAWAMPPALLETLGIDCDGDHTVVSARYPELAKHVANHNARAAGTAALRKIDKTRTPSVDQNGEYIWSRAAHLAESRSPLLPSFVRLQAAFLASNVQDEVAAELQPLLYDTGLPRGIRQQLEQLLRPAPHDATARTRIVAELERSLDATRAHCQARNDAPLEWLACQLKADLRYWTTRAAHANPVALSDDDRTRLLDRWPALGSIIGQPQPGAATLFDRNAHRHVIVRWAANAPESFLCTADAPANATPRDLLAAALAQGHTTFTNTSKTRVDSDGWHRVAQTVDRAFTRHRIARTAPHDQKELARRYARGPLDKAALLASLSGTQTLAGKLMQRVVEQDMTPSLFARRKLAAWASLAPAGAGTESGSGADDYDAHFPALAASPAANDPHGMHDPHNPHGLHDRLENWPQASVADLRDRAQPAYDRDFPAWPEAAPATIEATGARPKDRASGAGARRTATRNREPASHEAGDGQPIGRASDTADVASSLGVALGQVRAILRASETGRIPDTELPCKLLQCQKLLAELPPAAAAAALRHEGLGQALGALAASLMHQMPQAVEPVLAVHIAILDKLCKSGDISPSELVDLLVTSPRRSASSVRQVLASHLGRPIGKQYIQALDDAARGNDALKERIKASLSIRELDAAHSQFARQSLADFYNRAKHTNGRYLEMVLKRIERVSVSRSSSVARLAPQRAEVVYDRDGRLDRLSPAQAAAKLHAALERGAGAAVAMQQAALIPPNRELGKIVARVRQKIGAIDTPAAARAGSTASSANAHSEIFGNRSIGEFIDEIVPAVGDQQEKDRTKLEYLATAAAHRATYAQRAAQAQQRGPSRLAGPLASLAGGLASNSQAMVARKREQIAAAEARRELERQQEQASRWPQAVLGQSVIGLAAGALLTPSVPSAPTALARAASSSTTGARASSPAIAQALSSRRAQAGTSWAANASADTAAAPHATAHPFAPTAPAISEAAQLAALARLPAPPSGEPRRQRARERDSARAD